MSSTQSPFPDIDPATVTARPSYESFLRIKQGIGSEALRAAGLPPVENLSYDAYVAAITRKAAEKRAAEQPRPAPAASDGASKARGKSRVSEAKRLAWTSLVVVPVALVAVILVISVFKGQGDGADNPNPSEAVASSLTSEGLTSDGRLVTLSVTEVTDLPPLPPAADDAEDEVAALPDSSFDSAPVEKVELLPLAKPAAEIPADAQPVKVTKKKKNAAAREAGQAAVVPVPERRLEKSSKKAATPTRKAAQKKDEFWQPLVDIFDGKGLRGATNVPPPEDRPGR